MKIKKEIRKLVEIPEHDPPIIELVYKPQGYFRVSSSEPGVVYLSKRKWGKVQKYHIPAKTRMSPKVNFGDHVGLFAFKAQDGDYGTDFVISRTRTLERRQERWDSVMKILGIAGKIRKAVTDV